MSYYSRRYASTDTSASLIIIALCVVVAFALMFGVNACSAEDWNDGVCTECSTRYELRGASRGLKYYSCPECGNEVERYDIW